MPVCFETAETSDIKQAQTAIVGSLGQRVMTAQPLNRKHYDKTSEIFIQEYFVFFNAKQK